MMAEWALINLSQMLAFLCVAGIAAALYRWPHARRRDFLVAFVLFLAGTFLHQLNLHLFGSAAWPSNALWAAALARGLQIVGSALFVRAALAETCGEWAWLTIFSVAALAAWMV